MSTESTHSTFGVSPARLGAGLALGLALLVASFAVLAIVDPAPRWVRTASGPMNAAAPMQPALGVRPFDYDVVLGTSLFSTQTHAVRRGDFGGRSIALTFRPLHRFASLASEPQPSTPSTIAARFGLNGASRTSVVADPQASAVACFHLKSISYGFPFRAFVVTTLYPWDPTVTPPPGPTFRVHWLGLGVDILLFTVAASLLLVCGRAAFRSRSDRHLCSQCGQTRTRGERRCPECGVVHQCPHPADCN